MFFSECKYSEEEAAAKKADFSKKREEPAAKSAAFKPPFAGWNPGFIMPTPPTHVNNNVDMM